MTAKTKSIVIATDAEKWIENVSKLMAALSSHLTAARNIEFSDIQRFTVVGMTVGLSFDISSFNNDLLKEWGFSAEKR